MKFWAILIFLIVVVGTLLLLANGLINSARAAVTPPSPDGIMSISQAYGNDF